MELTRISDTYIKNVFKGSSLILSQSLLLNITGIIYFGIAARYLPYNEVSLLLMSSVIINLFPILFSFALPTSALKFCAENYNLDKSLTFRITKIIFYISFIFFIVSISLGYLLIYIIFSPIGILNFLFLLLLTIDASLNNLLIFLYSILLGHFKYGKAVLSASLASVLRFLLASYVIVLGGNYIDVLKVWVLSDGLGVICALIFSIKLITNKVPKIKFPRSIIKDLFKFSLPLYFSVLTTYFFLYIDRYFVFYNIGYERFAIYGAAITASMIFINIPQYVITALLPYFSSMYMNNKSEFLSLFKRIVRIVCITFVPSIILISMLAQPLIFIFAGEKYVSSWYIFFIVTLIVGMAFPYAILSSYFLAKGESKVILYGSLVSILAGAILVQSLYKYYEIIGAAYGRALMFLTFFIFLALWIYFKDKIDYGVKFHLSSIFLSLVLFSPIIIINLFFYTNILIQLIVSLILIFIYLIILVYFKILKEVDIETLSLILPKFINNFIYKLFFSPLFFKKNKPEIKVYNIKDIQFSTLTSTYIYAYISVKTKIQ